MRSWMMILVLVRLVFHNCSPCLLRSALSLFFRCSVVQGKLSSFFSVLWKKYSFVISANLLILMQFSVSNVFNFSTDVFMLLSLLLFIGFGSYNSLFDRFWKYQNSGYWNCCFESFCKMLCKLNGNPLRWFAHILFILLFTFLRKTYS